MEFRIERGQSGMIRIAFMHDGMELSNTVLNDDDFDALMDAISTFVENEPPRNQPVTLTA